MPTVADALFEDLRAILLKVREGAGVIVGLDRDVLDARPTRSRSPVSR
jgi:hypothetical protein